MLVSHKHKLVFIHVMKTGGTSISMSLLPIMKPMKRLRNTEESIASYSWGSPHDPLSKTRVVDVLKKFPSYTKAAFVRNPWDRIFSSFYHNAYLYPFRNNLGFERAVSKMKTQSYYLKNKHGVIDIDFIGRFESLKSDFNRLCDLVNIPRMKLLHENKNPMKPKIPYWEFYNPKKKRIVDRYFAEDIALLGYKFGE